MRREGENFREDSNSLLQEVVNSFSQTVINEQIGRGSSQNFFPFQESSFHHGAVKIFENDSFEVFMVKTYHKRQTKFKFEDAIFHVKINIKNHREPPLLKDILDAMQSIVNFALSTLKSFVNPSLKNICYLTIFQSPMIRGIKSAPFNLSEDTAQGTSNLLSKLNRYLVSNNELTLNETFILYVNILSLTHSQFLARARRRRAFRFGSGKSRSEYQNFWCIDVATTHEPSFRNKCLILCCIFAELQFRFFLSLKNDKRFKYASNVNSKLINKRTQAINIVKKELKKVTESLKILETEFENGLDFTKWKDQLSKHFKCQITIFTGKEFSSKIFLMHPEKYDDGLKQFYFYSPKERPNHLLFIRHLGSYFKNNIMTCTACKKTFKTHHYKHLCDAKDNCFACRKPLQKPHSFICPTLQDDFCDKLLTKDKLYIECTKCNLLLESKQCLESHKKLCGDKGQLGFKCKKCNKFFYKNGTNYKNGEEIAEKHTCGEIFCRHCKLYYSFSENNAHLCKLKKEYLHSFEESLAFLTFFTSQNSSYNCIDCFQNQNDYVAEKNISWKDLFFDVKFSELLCPSHKNNLFEFEPNALCIYKQNSSKSFMKFELSEFNGLDQDQIFLNQNMPYKRKTKIKLTEDFQIIIRYFQRLQSYKVMDNFLKLILNESWCHYTIILSDPFGFFLKRLTSELISHGICPKLINDVGKVILLEIPQLKLRFITTEMYHFDSKLEEAIIKTYLINDHFFPSQFNKPENYTYDGKIPNLKFFLELSDSELLAKKRLYLFRTTAIVIGVLLKSFLKILITNV